MWDLCVLLYNLIREGLQVRGPLSKNLRDKGTNNEGVFGESFPAKGACQVPEVRAC